MASKAYKSLIVQLGIDGSGVQNGLSEINRNISHTQREINLLNKGLKLEFDSEKFRRAQELAQRQVQQTTERVNKLRQGIEEADRQGIDKTTNAFRELERELLAAENAAKRAEKQLRDINNIAIDRVVIEFERLGDVAENIGSKLTKSVTVPLTAAGGAIYKLTEDMNKNLANIGTLGVDAERLRELRSGIQEIAIITAKNTSDIAEGAYSVVSALGDTSDTLKITEINAKAAAAGLATTQESINLTTAVTKGYGDTSAEATQKAADLAFETLRLGQTTFPELAASIGRVVPASKALGIAQEELFTVFATLTGVTGNASEVATQYGAVLSALMNPSKEMQEQLEKMGYSSGFAAVQSLGFKGVLDELVKSVGGSDEELTKLAGRKEAITAMLALTGAQADVFTQKMEALSNATGAAERAFIAQSEGMNEAGFTIQQSIVRLQVAAQGFGDTMAPAVDKVATSIENLTKWFTSLDEEQRKLILQMGGIVAVLGPTVLMIGKLSKGIGAAIQSYNAIKTAVNAYKAANEAAATSQAVFNGVMAANPALLVASALAVLTAGVAAFIIATKDATSETDNLIKSSKALTKEIDNYKSAVDDATNSEMANAVAAGKLADELFDLAEKTDKTEAEKRKLYSITEQLNSLIPNLSLQIDNETGALNRQRGEVVALIEEYKRLALVKAAEKDIMELGEQLYSSQKIQLELEEQKKAEESKLKNNKKHGVYEAFGIITTEDVILTDIARIDNQIQKQIDNQRKIEEKIKLATDFINKNQSVADYRPSGPSTYVSPPQADPPKTVTVTSGTSSKLSKVDRARQEAIQKELDNLKFAKNMDLITEQEYYAKLAEFRDKYFEEGSKEWQQYTVEIYNYNKRLAEEQIKKEKEIAEENKRLVDDYIKRYKQYIEDRNFYSDWGADNEVDALNRAKTNLRRFVDEGKLSWDEYYYHVNDIEKRLYKLAQESYERQLQILKEFQSRREEAISSTLKKEQDSIKSATERKIKYIEQEYEAQKKLHEAKIEGIDLEIKKRRELRENEAQDDRINKIKREIEVLQAKLQFERDAENIIQLNREIARKQQELANAEQEKADTLFYRQKELEKEAIRNEIEALWEEAERKKEQAKIEEQNLLYQAELRARRKLNEVTKDFVLSAATLQNTTNNTSNTTNNYDQRKNTVVIHGGTLTSAALANFLNK